MIQQKPAVVLEGGIEGEEREREREKEREGEGIYAFGEKLQFRIIFNLVILNILNTVHMFIL